MQPLDNIYGVNAWKMYTAKLAIKLISVNAVGQ